MNKKNKIEWRGKGEIEERHLMRYSFRLNRNLKLLFPGKGKFPETSSHQSINQSLRNLMKRWRDIDFFSSYFIPRRRRKREEVEERIRIDSNGCCFLDSLVDSNF